MFRKLPSGTSRKTNGGMTHSPRIVRHASFGPVQSASPKQGFGPPSVMRRNVTGGLRSSGSSSWLTPITHRLFEHGPAVPH
jgi:hypothetical protein